MTIISGYDFETTKYGMLRQLNPVPFHYDLEYISKQSETYEMAHTRMRIIWDTLGLDAVYKSRCVEIGPGRGVFFDTLWGHVATLEAHDTVDSEYSTITAKKLKKEKWDILFAFDVIEHFENIDELFNISFEYGMFSFPCMPKNGIFSEWRHFKPNEHIYYLDDKSFTKWVEHNGYKVIHQSNDEDKLRKRWDAAEPNISTFIIQKH